MSLGMKTNFRLETRERKQYYGYAREESIEPDSGAPQHGLEWGAEANSIDSQRIAASPTGSRAGMGDIKNLEDSVIEQQIEKELENRPPQLDIPELESAEVCCEVLASTAAVSVALVEGTLVLPFILVYTVVLGLGIYLFSLPKLCDRACLAVSVTPRLLEGARLIALLLLPFGLLLAIPATVVFMVLLAVATAYVHAYFAILNGRQV